MASHQENGIIVGTSRRQEWLLPWWWLHYRYNNHYPVIFVDFGDMSEPAIEWCKQRGSVAKIKLTDDFIAKKETIEPSAAAIWEKMQPNVWELRSTWYKKPLALQLSPFKNTVWLDLDCQVRGSLESLFFLCHNEGGFAIAPEHVYSQDLNLRRGFIKTGQTMYNTGVMVYKQDSKIVNKWVMSIKDQNHLFCSEQQLLSSLLNAKKYSFTSLSTIYNWTADMNCKSDVVILHWWGDVGKTAIAKFMKEMTTQFYIDFSFFTPS